MILAHVFDEEKHLYKVESQYVLGTSDVLTLCKYSDYSQIPQGVLDNASHKGTQVHKAIEWFETDGCIPEVPEEYQGYFDAYLAWKCATGFQAQHMELRLVYVHEGTGQPIGCTIDLRGAINGVPWIVDVKTNAKMYGAALKQKRLCWRLQLQSYCEGSEMEDPIWANCGKGVIQLFKDGTYEFHDFSDQDDQYLWDASIRVAMGKLAAGHRIDR